MTQPTVQRRLAGRERHWIVAIVAVALLLRVGLVAMTPGFVPAYDAADYQRIAVAIAHTGGYPPTTYADPGSPSAFRPPAWPYALAATKVVAGDGWTAGRLLGAALGTLSVLLVFLVARRLCSRRVALLAAGFAAVFPPLVFTDVALLSEPLFVASVLGMVWLLLRARSAHRALPWLAAAGAVCGLAILTRSSGLVLLAPLTAAAALATGGTWRRLGGVAVALAAVAVVLAPWTVRNAVTLDAFVPVSTQGGWTLAATYNWEAARPDQFQAASRVPTDVPELRAIIAAGGNEAAIDRRLRAAARRYMQADPGYVLTAIGRNTQRLWASGGPDQRWLTRLAHEEMNVPARLDGLLALSALMSFLLAVGGAVVLVRRRRLGAPLWLWAIPVLLWLTTVVVSGKPRYRVAIDPFVLMLAAVAVAALAGRLVAARRRAAASVASA